MYSWFKRHFIPNEGNGYKPHFLEEAAMGGMLCLVLLSFTIANMQSLLWITSDWLVGTILPAVIIAETNDERGSEELPMLVRNSTLDEAAQLKADDMAKGEYFSHNSPDGKTPWYWFKQASYDYLHAGENLAIHFTDSSEVVEAWMDSPTHRANIMNGDYREIGIGTAKGEYEGYPTVYVVQLFGTPRAKTVAAAEAVSSNVPTIEAEAFPDEQVEPIVTEAGAVLAAEEQNNESEPELKPEIETKPDTIPVANKPPVEDVLIADEIASEAETQKEVETILVPTSTPKQELEKIEIPEDPENSVIVLEHISTSTTGTVGSVTPGGESTPPTAAFMTQPYKVLQFVYVMIGCMVAFVLAASIVIEVRRQHPLHVVYSTGLMSLMVALLYVHIALSSGVRIV